jgi:hypothetical protein
MIQVYLWVIAVLTAFVLTIACFFSVWSFFDGYRDE